MSHALGVRLLETDVHATADGVALAFHDATLARLTGLPGRVSDYTWDELRSVRIEGEPLLRLDMLLNAFPDAAFLVDVKGRDCVAPTISAIQRTRSAERVCVAGGMERWLKAVSDATGCPRAMGFQALSGLMSAAKLGLPAPRGIFSGVMAAHLPTRLLGLAWMACPSASRRLVESVQEQGLLLRAWTVNDPDDMTHFLRMGVDSIITDYPDVLRAIMVRECMWTSSTAQSDVNLTPAPVRTETHTRSPALSA